MSDKFISWSIFILLCFIWGSSFILMKEGERGLTSSQLASLRIFSASVVLIPFAIFHFRKVPRKHIPVIFLAGICGNLIPAFLFAIVIAKLGHSALVGILNALTPICAVVIGIVLFRDKFETRKIIGVLVGFGGLCLLTFTQDNVSLDHLGYASLVVIATIFYGLSPNLVSHYLKGVSSAHITSISLSLLAVPCFIILWLNGFFELDFTDPVIQLAVFDTLLLGIVGSAIATFLFYIMLKKAGVLFSSLVTYGIPFVAILWGVLDNEPITFREIGCLAIILSGVYLVQKKAA